MPQQRIVRGFGLYEKLREHKPTKLIAFTEDEDERIEVNVPDVRQGKARAMAALAEVPWIRVDLLDKKGGLLHRHNRCADDRDAPAGELEELRSHTARTAELAGLLSIVVKAQDTAVIRHQQGMDQLLQRQNELLGTIMKQLEFQASAHREAMQMNHALSADLVNGQLQQLQLVAPAAETDDEGNPRPQTNSDRAVAAFLPAFMRAVMGGPPDRKPAKAAVVDAAAAAVVDAATTNGVKTKAAG